MELSSASFLVQSVLEERFGLGRLKDKQEEVIDALLAGKHTLALLPTGYGKSLCYQLPSQVLPGATIVVSPLISLMQDQLSKLSKRGIRNAACLNSSMSPAEQDEIMFRLAASDLKLLYLAPERFESGRFRQQLDKALVSLVVIDEAHCISQWGHDFRLQYRNLSTHIMRLRQATVLALTATATVKVQRDIVKTLGLPRMQIISASFDRPNLRFEAKKLAAVEEKEKELLKLLHKEKSAIVYTSSRKESERLALLLEQNGIASAAYHAGMSPALRQRNQMSFEKGKVSVIVSTVAFGMGIDKPDVTRVVHFNLPPSLENYFQEAGRAGRDGMAAICTLLYQAKDISVQKWLIGKSYPTEEELKKILKAVQSRGLSGLKAPELARNMQLGESAVMSALSFLKDQQLLDCSADGTFFDRTSASLQAGSGEDNSSIDMGPLLQRKELELRRLEQAAGYASSDTCRRQALLEYFGQALISSCSGCDVCS